MNKFAVVGAGREISCSTFSEALDAALELWGNVWLECCDAGEDAYWEAREEAMEELKANRITDVASIGMWWSIEILEGE